jgi:hypothetical protein
MTRREEKLLTAIGTTLVLAGIIGAVIVVVWSALS